MSSAIPNLMDIHKNISGAFKYAGEFFPDMAYANGDIVTKNGVPYVCITTTGKEYTLEPLGEVKETVQTRERKVLPLICKCCGAPLHDYKCDYCGVEYG